MKNKSPYIMVMVGLPGSGKSTIASLYRNAFDDNGAVVLSTDDYIQHIVELSEGRHTYDDLFKDHIGDAERYVADAFAEALALNVNIIWDQTNLSRKKRARILSQVPGHYHKAAMYVEVDEDTRQERLKAREGKTIPVHIDEKMYYSVQIPQTDEGFDEVILSNVLYNHREK